MPDNTNAKTSSIFQLLFIITSVVIQRSFVDFTYKPKCVLVLNFKKKHKAFAVSTTAAGAVVCWQEDYMQLTRTLFVR